MYCWNITYKAKTEDIIQEHYATIYANTLGEALDKLERATQSEIIRYNYNLDELKNGVKK